MKKLRKSIDGLDAEGKLILTPWEMLRFWTKVAEQPGRNGCWLWTGDKNAGGYGMTSFRTRNVLVHRLAFRAFRGIIPGKLCVLHECDVRNCIRPSHLWTGTHKDNSEDMLRKGRHWVRSGDQHGLRLHPESVRRGEQSGTAKLTSGQVKEIRALYAKGVYQYMIAGKFGIAQGQVSRIVLKQRWAHIK